MDQSEILIHQLFQTVRIISKGLNKRLEPYNLYHSEWSLITTLKKKGPMTQGALANYLNIEPPAVSRSLMNLEKKGFITRALGVDKREKTVFLSETALHHYPTWLEVSGHHRHTILADLSGAQQAELTQLLKTVFQRAQQHEKT